MVIICFQKSIRYHLKISCVIENNDQTSEIELCNEPTTSLLNVKEIENTVTFCQGRIR